MKLTSCRDLKAGAMDQAEADPAAFAAALGAQPPADDVGIPMALGVSAGKRADDFRLTIITEPGNEAAAERMKANAGGEAVVRVMRVEARITPRWLQRIGGLAESGRSAGHRDITAGTLGPFVRDVVSGRLGVVSNNHVFVNVNRGRKGDPLFSPGPLDAAPSDATRFGELERFVPIDFGRANQVDCALGWVDVEALPGWNGAIARVVRDVHELRPSDLGVRLRKIGRTTGVRLGRVTTVELDRLPVGFGPADGVAMFNDQIEISGGRATDFSAGGDSGSAIVTEDGRLVGLLFAGGLDNSGEDFTFANRIGHVFAALGVRAA